MVMAYIYVLLGDYDDAMDEMEVLLSVPACFSAHVVQLDPLLAPLRDHPRFEKLLKEGESRRP